MGANELFERMCDLAPGMRAGNSARECSQASLSAHVLGVAFRDEMHRVAATSNTAQMADFETGGRRRSVCLQIGNLMHDNTSLLVGFKALAARTEARTYARCTPNFRLHLAVSTLAAAHSANKRYVTACVGDLDATGLVQIDHRVCSDGQRDELNS